MGRSYSFECCHCGYRVAVSGGPDSGRDLQVETIACRKCRKLYDVVVRCRVPSGLRLATLFGHAPPSFEHAVRQLPHKDLRHSQWKEWKPACPVSARHPVEPWSHPGKCPACGVFLERSALPFRAWE